MCSIGVVGLCSTGCLNDFFRVLLQSPSNRCFFFSTFLIFSTLTPLSSVDSVLWSYNTGSSFPQTSFLGISSPPSVHHNFRVLFVVR